MRTNNRSVLVTVRVMGLVLVCFASVLTHAQTPARPKHPAGVPDEYVITPFGYFHPSCVLHVAEGETLLADGRVLRHANGILENIPACAHPHYNASGEILAAGAEKVGSPTVSGWVESASVFTSTSYGEIVATWTVPPAPTSNNGQTVYFFPGLEDVDDVVSIVQPVLQYGSSDAGGGNYWAIASWNCCLSGTADYSSLVSVSPGDTIRGTIESACGAGTESCSTWNISTEDVTSGRSTTLSNTPSDGQTFNWAFGGVLEAYGITQCSDYPPNNLLNFSSIALYDYNFDLVSPDWLALYWAPTETPQCGYNLKTTAAQVTVDYEPIWSDQDLSAITGGALAAPGSALTSAAASSAEDAYYLGANQHVNVLYFPLSQTPTSWNSADLTALTGGALAATGSKLTSVAASSAEDVFYLGTNHHAYVLYLAQGSTSWSFADLTSLTGGALAASGSALTSVANSSGEEDLYYLGTNQHVDVLYLLQGGSWSFADLTALTGGALAASGSALTSVANSSGEEDLYYLGTNQHVDVLYLLQGGSWSFADLTALTGGALAASGSALTSVANSSGEEDLYYLGTNQHVDVLYLLQGGSWSFADLTALTSGALAASGSALTSVANSSGEEDLYYLGTNQHVDVLYLLQGGSWSFADLTALTGGALAASGSALASFADTTGEHAFYLGTNQHLYQLYF